MVYGTGYTGIQYTVYEVVLLCNLYTCVLAEVLYYIYYVDD